MSWVSGARQGASPGGGFRPRAVHQGGLERELLHRQLDGRPIPRDPLVVIRARRLAAALVAERLLQPFDLALEPPDAREGRQQGSISSGLGSPPSGSTMTLSSRFRHGGSDHPGQQMGRRHRDARQCPAELDLTRFDPAAEATSC